MLGAGDVEVGFAHARVALDAHARLGHSRLRAEDASPVAPVLVVELEQGDVGEAVLVAESDSRCV